MGFRPQRMRIAKITLKKNLGRIFLKLIAGKTEIEIIDLVKTANIEPLAPSEIEKEFQQLVLRLKKINDHLRKLQLSEECEQLNLEEKNLPELKEKALKILKRLEPIEEDFNGLEKLEQEVKDYEIYIKSLDELKKTEISDIHEFGTGSHFYAKLGYIRGIQRFRLEMALDQLTGGEFLFKELGISGEKSICLVGVMNNYRSPVDRLLSGLGFHSIEYPADLKGTPNEALNSAIEKSEELHDELKKLKAKIKEEIGSSFTEIRAITEQVNIEIQRMKVLRRTQQRNDNYLIWAWVPKNEVKNLRKLVDQLDPSISIKIIKPELEESEIPTKVSNNFYSRPFEDLVHGFGTPGYNEWDPTKIISILIPIFFGIMFADVIDGLVVLLIGIYGLSLNPKKYSKSSMIAELQNYFDKGGPVLVTIGITAMIFGFLFGSYRGLGGEHALHYGLPILWFSPEIEGGQFALLEMAIFIGSIVIGLALILQFLGTWSHDKKEAIFLPGMFLLFYIGLVFLIFTFGPNPTLWLSATDGKFDLRALQNIAQYQEELMHHEGLEFASLIGGVFESLGVPHWGIPVFAVPGLNMSYPFVLLIVSLLFTTGYHFKAGMDGISEWLDYLITMISNTISFARIFAYTMVHGSLSLVFIQIFELFFHSPFPGMFFGAFIVIPLELLVSFLQSLRLCWVEFFGKLHYQGTGYKFSPFKEQRLFTTNK
ncbi:MAG: V-type ATP synthase subunit I [Candidatus Hodarchaeales archaeon]